MKPRDFQGKRTRLGEIIPGFLGYQPRHHPETDYLLRRFLTGEMEKVRDRLADLLAGRRDPAALHDKPALCLRRTAALKESLEPEPEEVEAVNLSSREEERVLDLDLALLEKIAGLHTPLDRLETAHSADEVQMAAAMLEEGLDEVEDLFAKRRLILAGQGPESGGPEKRKEGADE